MRKLIALLILLLATNALAWDIPKFKNEQEIRDWVRPKKSEAAMLKTNNKSCLDLKSQVIPSGTHFGKNFSYCDFEGTDIRGCIFQRCNFSFAINLDKAISDEKTLFSESNLTFALELPKAQMIKCNLGPRPITDKMIEDFFEEDIISSDNLISR